MLTPVTDLPRFHHVALSVRDRDLSANWYAAVLGFEELFREDGEERRACVMRSPSGGCSVAVVEHLPAQTVAFDPRRPGLDHVAFTVASRIDLETWAARLTAAGVQHSEVIDIPPGGILNFKDPDGIALAFFWERN